MDIFKTLKTATTIVSKEWKKKSIRRQASNNSCKKRDTQAFRGKSRHECLTRKKHCAGLPAKGARGSPTARNAYRRLIAGKRHACISAMWRRVAQANRTPVTRRRVAQAYHKRTRHAFLSALTYWTSKQKKHTHRCWQKHSHARALQPFNPYEAKFWVTGTPWQWSKGAYQVTWSFLSNWRIIII